MPIIEKGDPIVLDQSFAVDENSDVSLAIDASISAEAEAEASRLTDSIGRIQARITRQEGRVESELAKITGYQQQIDDAEADGVITSQESRLIARMETKILGSRTKIAEIETAIVDNETEIAALQQDIDFLLSEEGLSYAIIGGDPDNLFQIDADGVVTTADGSQFDFEGGPASYTLVIEVTETDLDGSSSSTIATTTIDVGDVNETPTDIVMGTSVEENAAGGVVSTISAVDPDDSSTANGTIVTYEVDDSRFVVEDGTDDNLGQMVLKLKDGISLDHETEPEVTLKITVTDGGDPSLSYFETFTFPVIDVNEAPTGITLSSTTVMENSAGGVVGTVTVADPDDPAEPFGTHTFVVSDTRFEVVDGQLKLVDGVSLDHEAGETVMVTVAATDGGGLDTTQTFAIAVGDVNEAPTAVGLSSTVVDENVAGAVIGDLSATDSDAAGEAFGDHSFTVSDARFEVVGGQLKLVNGVSLDHEAGATVSVTVTATDGGGLATAQTFVITVNDVNEAPTAITLSNATVDAATAGAPIGTITVDDPDDPTEPFGSHTFTVSDDRFEVVNGELQLKIGVELPAGSHTVDVVATDGGGLSTSQTFTIEAIGELELTLADDMVSENLPGDVAGALLVNGLAPLAGEYTFAVENDPRFEVVNGELKLLSTETLDFETQPVVTVSVVVTDTATGATTTKAVTVLVTDIGEVPSAIGTDGGALFDAAVLPGGNVTGLGDINGDGFADGMAYRPSTGTATVTLGSADGLSASGFTVTGLETNSILHAQYANVVGDINGDGLADMAFGAVSTGNGSVDVVFGQAGTGTIDANALNGGNGFTLTDTTGISTMLGYSVASAGDINGDGIDDLIVGASGRGDINGDGVAGDGAAYVVFGQAGGWSGTLDVADLNGDNGFRIDSLGDVNAGFAYAVSSAGDINGDGIDDFMVGAWEHDSLNGTTTVGNTGQTYVVFGHEGGWDPSLDLASLNGANGFRIDGLALGDNSGVDVAVAGDVNGDGIEDMIIGAFGDNGAAAAYVVYGDDGGLPAALDLSTLDGTNGFRLDTVAADWVGWEVSSAGDINADGFDDLIVSSPLDSNFSGAAYVVFGGPGIATGTLGLEDITTNSDLGFKINGSNGAVLGFTVTGGGDIDGDGFDDLIVSEYDTELSFVVYGSNVTNSVTGDITDAAGGTLLGTVVDDHLLGDAGNDVLIGNGGADVLYGGAGDDLLSVGDAGFMRIDGGGGFDTLALDGAGITLDLTQVGDATIQGIEAIDLTGSGDNSLTLELSDLLQVSDATNDLFVTGDLGDSVAMVGSWAVTGAAVIDGVAYDTYSVAGIDATLYVDQDLATSISAVV